MKDCRKCSKWIDTGDRYVKSCGRNSWTALIIIFIIFQMGAVLLIGSLYLEKLEISAKMENQKNIIENKKEDISKLNMYIEDKEDKLERKIKAENLKKVNIEEEKEEDIEKKKETRQREMLGDHSFYENLDLRETVNIEPGKLDEVAFEGMENLEGLGKYFVHAEKKYEVNSIFLAALAIHESRGGNSNIAVERKNLFGFNAFTHAPENAEKFPTYRECIYEVAKYISENYLDPSGNHFEGYTVEDINVNYAADRNWSNEILRIMEDIYSEL